MQKENEIEKKRKDEKMRNGREKRVEDRLLRRRRIIMIGTFVINGTYFLITIRKNSIIFTRFHHYHSCTSIHIQNINLASVSYFTKTRPCCYSWNFILSYPTIKIDTTMVFIKTSEYNLVNKFFLKYILKSLRRQLLLQDEKDKERNKHQNR